jgi:hypothetical protein
MPTPMSNDSAIIGISYVESIPRELIDSFLNEMRDDRIEIIEEQRPDAMFFASIEWFIPTAVFLYLSKGYFDGFLQAVGEDHYELLKNSLPRWFNRLSRIRVTYLASANKKLRPDNPFTGAISLLGEGKGSAFKLMFRHEADETEIAQSIVAFLEFLRHFHSGSTPSDFIVGFEASEPVERLRLVYFDIEARKLRLVDPKQRRQRVSQ